MNTLVFRGGSLPIALVAIAAGLLAPIPTAIAATTVETAASAFGLSSYTVVEMPSGGDVTDALARATKAAGAGATVLHLPAGQLTVRETVRPGNNVYLVAEPGAKVVWKGGSGQPMVRFSSVTGGAYGGTWDAGSRGGSGVIVANSARVQLSKVTITRGSNHGIGAYEGSQITLRDVTTSANKVDGIHLEGSTLDASGLTSTLNRRNGVQLSSKSTGTISNSTLDRNGQAVKGSTTGKTGHGLGLAGARVTVSNTSISNNKVCGVSLTAGAVATISGSHLDHNGRHGLGTVPGVTATISASTANQNGYNGILASGKGTQVSLQGVTITSTKKIGLSVPSKGSASISGSVISKSGTQNLSVSAGGSLTMLADNTITQAKQHGIAVSGKSTLTVSGTGNLVSRNRKNGLLLTNSGTRGTITAPVSFQDNHVNGRVLSKAKLTTVACSFSGKGGNKITAGTGGKVTIVA